MDTANWGETTQLAFATIADDLLLQDQDERKFLDPLVVLDHLHDTDNFKDLPELLKETMVNASICESKSSYDDCFNILYNRLLDQDKRCEHKKRKPEITVKRWFSLASPVSHTIGNRQDAISVCFALELNLNSAKTFLNKCGHASFNVRSAKDATYIYCLANKRPLESAEKIITSYYNSIADDTAENAYKQSSQSNTTHLLYNQVSDGFRWTNDDDFLNNFLISNKMHFISYSKTAYREYTKLKNPIYLYTLKKLLAFEQSKFEYRKKEMYIHDSQKDFPVTVEKSEVLVSYKFISKLKKHASSTHLLQEAFDKLDVHVERIDSSLKKSINNCKVINNSINIVDYISSELIRFENDDYVQRCVSVFLTDIVTADKMLLEWLPSVMIDDSIDNDSRQRPYNKSELKDTVMRSFPHRHFFTSYDKTPEKYIENNSLRKAIILLYYMRYSYNYLSSLKQSDPIIAVETAFGLDRFMYDLNTILSRCQLGTLYPANQFDWLILQSVEKFDITPYKKGDEFSEEEDTPIAFFNNVLDYSFNSDPEIE